MSAPAYFGKPVAAFVPGGTHITVYLVPVFEGRLLAFDVRAKAARGRWLPWDALPFAGNPYETASELADDWCGGAMKDLQLVDIMSLEMPVEGWELAIIFRAELTALPEADVVREPHLFPEGRYDAIASFDPVDLERWVSRPSPARPTLPGGERLVF